MTSCQPTCCEVLLIGQMTSAGVVGQKTAGDVLQAGEGPPGERALDGGVIHMALLLKPGESGLDGDDRNGLNKLSPSLC